MADRTQTLNTHQSTFPWTSFNSFALPPFSSFSASFHPSRVHSETAEIEEISAFESPPDTPPLPPDLQRNRRPASPYPSQRGTSSPQTSLLFTVPTTLPLGPPSPISPITQSVHTNPQSTPLQSSGQPDPFIETKPLAIPRHDNIPRPPFTTLENSLAGSFTRRFARPVGTPITEVEPNNLGEGTLLNPYTVDFSPSDSANPLNWNKGFKWLLTVHLSLILLCAVFTSSSYIGGIESMQVHFRGLSDELAVAGLSTYLLGQALGPLIFAPLSEIFGRRQVFLFSWPLFVLFILVCAVAKNISTILVIRFFAGLFSSAQLSNQAGQIKDMWKIEESIMPGGLALLAPMLGPVLGPMISGFVGENSGFRAIFYVSFAWGLFHLITWTFFVPETHAPTLLRRKAAKLQKQADQTGTGEHFIGKYDKTKESAIGIIKVGLARPFKMLFREVIVWTISLYMAILYGTLYLLFTAFPIIFQELRGWTLGLSGLALLGIGIGMAIGFFVGGAIHAQAYARARADIPDYLPVPPEVRLRAMTVGAIVIPIGLFGFAWTATSNVHWVVCIIFSVIFGTGYIILFASGLLYLLDAYNMFAASAVAANGMLRFLFGAAFPLFAFFLFDNLGVHWAVTLLAFLSVAFAPIPFLFYRYGPFLRRKSKYIPMNSFQTARGPAAASTLAQSTTTKTLISQSSERPPTRDPSPPTRNLIAQGQDCTPATENRSNFANAELAARDEIPRRPSSPAVVDSRSNLGYEPVAANLSRSSFAAKGRFHSSTPARPSRSESTEMMMTTEMSGEC